MSSLLAEQDTHESVTGTTDSNRVATTKRALLHLNPIISVDNRGRDDQNAVWELRTTYP